VIRIDQQCVSDGNVFFRQSDCVLFVIPEIICTSGSVSLATHYQVMKPSEGARDACSLWRDGEGLNQRASQFSPLITASDVPALNLL
jgi:hypothetical protein